MADDRQVRWRFQWGARAGAGFPPPVLPWAVAHLTLVFVLWSGVAVAREKIDVITLSNGDRVTGEIKKLDVGQLEISTDLMAIVRIEWAGVVGIESSQRFELEDGEGHRYYGSLAPGPSSGQLAVGDAGSQVVLSHLEIVTINQIEKRRRSRWDGHMDLGLNLASAHDETNLSLDAMAVYRSELSRLEFMFATYFSDRDDTDETLRSQLGTSLWRTIRGNTFWISFAKLESNQELELDLRVTMGGGIGRYLIRDSRSELSLAGALAGNREQYSETPTGDWNAELFMAVNYDLFLFGGSETRLSTTLGILPSLSTWGRYRVEFSTSYRRKLVRDLSISVSLYDSYDSDPPTTDAVGNDWGLTTSFGWNF